MNRYSFSLRIPSSASRWWVLVALTAFWGAAVASRLLWNGDVYGLYYGILHGDGACYALAAYSFAGEGANGPSEILAAYAKAGVPVDALTEPGTCEKRKISPRVMYPLLSAPFVKFLGINGMLVVPALSWLTAIMVPAFLLLRRNYVLGAFLAGSLAIASTSIARWSVANITDALLMGLAAMMLACLPIGGKRVRLWRVGVVGVLVMFASLTKQTWPIWIAMVVIPWLAMGLVASSQKPALSRFGKENAWLPLVLVVVPVSLASHLVITATLGQQNRPALLSNVLESTVVIQEPEPSSGDGGESIAPDNVEQNENQSSLKLDFQTSTLIYVMQSSGQVAATEIGQLIVLDRALLLLIFLSLLSSWLNRQWPGSIVMLAVFATTIALSLVSTAVGINFRFQLPAVPFMILVAGALMGVNARKACAVWNEPFARGRGPTC